MGIADRTIRTTLALVIATLIVTGRIGGVLAILLSVFAVAFLLTSAAGSCPAYSLLGISTRGK
jgi:hypothetical protein